MKSKPCGLANICKIAKIQIRVRKQKNFNSLKISLANTWNSQLFQIEKVYLHAFHILYLVWGPYSTILFHQVLFPNAISVEAVRKAENRLNLSIFSAQNF